MKSGYRLCVVLAGVYGILASVGCSETKQLGPQESTATRQRFVGVSQEEAFRAAQRVFRNYFPIDRFDAEEGTIYSRPTEVSGRGEMTQVRDVMTTTPNRRRQVAEMQVIPRGRDVIVACQVSIQRYDAAQQRAFRPSSGDDRPSANDPFKPDAGTTAKQRESWTNVGRNRALESQVLDSVRAQLQPTSAPTTAPATK